MSLATKTLHIIVLTTLATMQTKFASSQEALPSVQPGYFTFDAQSAARALVYQPQTGRLVIDSIVQPGLEVYSTGRYSMVPGSSKKWAVEVIVKSGTFRSERLWIHYDRSDTLVSGKKPIGGIHRANSLMEKVTLDNLIGPGEHPREVMPTGTADRATPQSTAESFARLNTQLNSLGRLDAGSDQGQQQCILCRREAKDEGTLSFELKNAGVSDSARAQIMASGVPEVPLRRALHSFNRAKSGAAGQVAASLKQNQLIVVDLTAPSDEPRMFTVDLENGKVTANKTSHGGKSNSKLCAHRFGNRAQSNLSSPGAYLTGNSFRGSKKYGQRLSMMLHPLDKDNSNSLSREIIFHESRYVGADSSMAGRSWGCLTAEPATARDLIRLSSAPNSTPRSTGQGGTLIYVYPNSDDIQNKAYWNDRCAHHLRSGGLTPEYIR